MRPSHVLIALVSFAAGVVFGHLTVWYRMGGQVMDAIEQVIPHPAAMKVRCVAKKYSWHFQHAGEDGELAEVDASFVSETNPAGLNPDDPRGRDDLVDSELVLPCQQQIEFSTASFDLIHSLGGLSGVKDVDAIPGVTERRFFQTAETPEAGRLSCVQLCGPGCKDHVSRYRIVSREQFGEWRQKAVKSARNG